MARNIGVTPFSGLPMDQREVEICEHKGWVGHPDTIMDGVCEATYPLHRHRKMD